MRQFSNRQHGVRTFTRRDVSKRELSVRTVCWILEFQLFCGLHTHSSTATSIVQICLYFSACVVKIAVCRHIACSQSIKRARLIVCFSSVGFTFERSLSIVSSSHIYVCVGFCCCVCVCLCVRFNIWCDYVPPPFKPNVAHIGSRPLEGRHVCLYWESGAEHIHQYSISTTREGFPLSWSLGTRHFACSWASIHRFIFFWGFKKVPFWELLCWWLVCSDCQARVSLLRVSIGHDFSCVFYLFVWAVFELAQAPLWVCVHTCLIRPWVSRL